MLRSRKCLRDSRIPFRTFRHEGHGSARSYRTRRALRAAVTNVPLGRENIVPLANEGGRLRWKIENEGFNVQKTGGYNLEHAYSNNENAIKVDYLVLKIAHLLTQLIEKGSLLKNGLPRGFGSVKDLAFRILEALRNATLTEDEFPSITQQRIQVRFVPP